MPELPEVETIRRHLERTLKGRRITKVFVDTKDHIVFDRASPNAVKRAALGARVKSVARKGKYLWLELDRKPWIVMHFGMSGNAEIRSDGKFSKIWGGEKLTLGKPKATLARPLYCRMVLEANDNVAVAFTDPRRFGRIRLANDPLAEPPIVLLGPDPLEQFPATKPLQKVLAARSAPIKAVLLDQTVFAGVGNWLADEILFQSQISPHRLAKSLTAAEVIRLRAKTLAIIRKAVSLDADYDRYPETWLFHDRWTKGKESYTSRGYEIKHDTVGGRTTAWVPALQK